MSRPCSRAGRCQPCRNRTAALTWGVDYISVKFLIALNHPRGPLHSRQRKSLQRNALGRRRRDATKRRSCAFPIGANEARSARGLSLDNEDWLGLPGSVLTDLYIRLRDETDPLRRTADPNDPVRASIAMAILQMSHSGSQDIADVEVRIRRLIAGLPAQAAPSEAKSASVSTISPAATPSVATRPRDFPATSVAA